MKLENSRENENRILIALLKLKSSDEVCELNTVKTDWNYILTEAEVHRVVPAVFQSIKTNAVETISFEIFRKFQQRREEIAKLNFGRTTKLIKLIKVLQKNGISVLAYKGMALAATAYGDIGLRQFTDIDLLIHHKDFPQLKNVFLQNDCLPAWKASEKQEKAARKHYYEYPFFYGENKTLIEVHWKFAEPFFAFDINIDEIFERAESINVLGKTIETLAAEDSLIVLAAHGSKHFWKRLSWICDISKLIENHLIDWDAVMRRAERTGALRMFKLALFLAEDILGAELPAEVKRRISADRNVSRIAKTIKINLFAAECRFSGWRVMARMHVQMRERKLDKLRYSQRLLKTKLLDSLFLPMGRPQ